MDDLSINEQRYQWQRYMAEIGAPVEILVAPGMMKEFGDLLGKHGVALVQHIPPPSSPWGSLPINEHPLMACRVAVVRHERGVSPPFSWEASTGAERTGSGPKPQNTIE